MIDRQPDMVVVAEAGNGPETVKSARKYDPDILLLDLRMPEMDGTSVIAELLRSNPQVQVVVLTSFSTENMITCALRSGARGCLLKDAPREDLFACIRSVHQGKTWIAPSLTAHLAAGLSNTALTEREMEVLSLLAGGQSNKEIAARIFVSEATVKSHLRNLFSKLRVCTRTGAVAAASRRGLVQI